MPLPAIALGIGRIVSGVVAGTARGLAIAGRATAKGATVAARATGKAARATGKVAGKAARSTGRAIGKTARSTAKGLKRITSRTSKSTGKKTLKSNAEKIRSNLTKAAKDLKKQRLNRDRIQRNVLERGEVRKMEKNIESTKTPTGKKVNSILKSPMSIFDKIFGFGGILLTGIIVNAIDGIVKKWEEFKKNNKPMFDFIGNVIKGIGDFIDTVSMKASTGELDKWAKVDEDGKVVGGALLTVKQVVEGFGGIIGKITNSLGKPRKKGVNAPTNTSFFSGGKPFQNRRAAGFIDFITFGITDKDQRGNLGWFGGSTVHSKSGYGKEMEWKDFFNHEKQILNLGDQSSIGSNTQVVVVNRTNTKIVPFQVPSTSETDVASSETSQNLSALWTG